MRERDNRSLGAGRGAVEMAVEVAKRVVEVTVPGKSQEAAPCRIFNT